MWLMFLMRALSSIPMIVSGIEAIHGKSKSGAEKKQLAMDALGLASVVDQSVDPTHAAAAQAATQVVSQVIDGVVAVANASNEMPVVPQAPAPPQSVVPVPATDQAKG
jgi:hypothetical protein